MLMGMEMRVDGKFLENAKGVFRKLKRERERDCNGRSECKGRDSTRCRLIASGALLELMKV